MALGESVRKKYGEDIYEVVKEVSCKMGEEADRMFDASKRREYHSSCPDLFDNFKFGVCIITWVCHDTTSRIY